MNHGDVIAAFITAINKGDLSAMGKLMTEDHRFIDSAGTELRGPATVCAAWRDFFFIMPDYRISIERMVTEADVTALFGTAEGTLNLAVANNTTRRIELPAAWKVSLRDGRIAVWQVYTDWGTVLRTASPGT
ncbi:MAG: nuclear transport factor 2 family protein [Bacteroidia bacterium]|nr:nuclear transport factor 2 family protein [Bacteroidia bacterium]